MLKPIVISSRNFSKVLSNRGFSLVEISVALGIGSLALFSLSQLMGTTLKTIAKANSSSDVFSIGTFLDSSFLTKLGCGVSLGIVDPKSKKDPSISVVEEAGEPAPITFSISPPKDLAASSAIPPLNYNGAISLRNALGSIVIAPGQKYGNFTIVDSKFSILPSPVPVLLPGSGMWAVKGQISITGSYPDPSAPTRNTTKVLTKLLAVKVVAIPNGGQDKATTSFTIKVVGCSSSEGLGEGAPVRPPSSLCSFSVMTSAVPDGTGELTCKAVACPFGSYISSYDSDGGAVCSSEADCQQLGGSLVMLADAKGDFAPKCKILSCPAGQLATGTDSDGYIASCDLNSNYFIKCTANNDWQCKASPTTGNLITQQTYRCDNGGNSAKICIEDCTKKTDTYCGCPLGGATYKGGPNLPRMTIDCLQNGSSPSAPDCKVTSPNTSFSGIETISGKYYCTKNGTTDCVGLSLLKANYTISKSSCGKVTASMDHNGFGGGEWATGGWPYRVTYCGGGDKSLFGMPRSNDECQKYWGSTEKALPASGDRYPPDLLSSSDLSCVTGLHCKLCRYDGGTYGVLSGNFTNPASDNPGSQDCSAPDSCGGGGNNPSCSNSNTCSTAFWQDHTNVDYTVKSWCY
jgi:hypothetical protein